MQVRKSSEKGGKHSSAKELVLPITEKGYRGAVKRQFFSIESKQGKGKKVTNPAKI